VSNQDQLAARLEISIQRRRLHRAFYEHRGRAPDFEHCWDILILCLSLWNQQVNVKS